VELRWRASAVDPTGGWQSKWRLMSPIDQNLPESNERARPNELPPSNPPGI
jgi:hypothetical protein